jgi:hypothetical protein
MGKILHGLQERVKIWTKPATQRRNDKGELYLVVCDRYVFLKTIIQISHCIF